MAWRPDYVTLNAQKLFERIDLDDNTDDAVISVAITAASRAIDDHCNRQFGQVAAPEHRRYTAYWDPARYVAGWCGAWVVPIDDLTDATGLAVTINGSAVTDYTLEPVNAVLDGKAWTELVISPASSVQPCGADNEVDGLALWGWDAFPTSVTQATNLQASRLGTRRDSPYGVAGSPDQGNEMRLLARVDADVAVVLRGYRRTRKVG